MKCTPLLILLLLIGFLSCNMNSKNNPESIEVWRTNWIVMNSLTSKFIDRMEEHSQYLYLYSNGKAQVLDSLKNGVVKESETTWDIRNRNGKEIFLFGIGAKSQGIRGVAYPIIIKSETDFKMAFDSLNVHHIWNLKRIK